ncbi:MAG: phenylpyruvate tautomerase MIF-related protein [Oscillospiraceae bacterium]|nr:phenylpyruvate tautomerase MIF-related protein [Oscillospiraceae bacterium]
MPFVHLSTTKTMTMDEKEILADDIAHLVATLPGKPYERTMVRIDAGCEIFRAGKLAECAYFQTHFQRPVPMEAQTAYIESLYALFNKRLGLDIPQIYMSMIELDTWGSRGTLQQMK